MKTEIYIMHKYITDCNAHCKFKRNIIVLSRLDALGDFVLWLDSAKEYRKKYPKVKIVVICRKDTAELAKTLDYFDKVIAVDTKKLSTDLVYLLYIQGLFIKLSGSILIQCVYSRTTIIDVVSAMIPAYSKWTIQSNDGNMSREELKYGNALYDRIVDITDKGSFELTTNAQFMRGLGFSSFKSDIPTLPNYGHCEKAIDMDYYVLVLGTGNSKRTWSTNNFAEVARYIGEKSRYTCCLLGVENEKEIGKIFEKGCKSISIINLIGKTSIVDYIQIIRGAKFVLSGDTSAAHIAVAVRTKSVVVSGGWHYGRFLPYKTETNHDTQYFPNVCCQKMDCYKCNLKRMPWSCKKDVIKGGKWSCIKAIKCEQVIQKLQETVL